VKTDPEALTSRITLSKLREQALAKQKHGDERRVRGCLRTPFIACIETPRGDLSRPACDHVKNR
jgi:hypothetical protein